MLLQIILRLESFRAPVTREVNACMFCHVILIVASYSEALLTCITPETKAAGMALFVSLQTRQACEHFATSITRQGAFFSTPGAALVDRGLRLPLPLWCRIVVSLQWQNNQPFKIDFLK